MTTKLSNKTYKIAIKVKTSPVLETYKAFFPFKEEDVKCGNIKDPDKIREKIEQARQAYVDEAEAEACGKSTTGRICLIQIEKQVLDGTGKLIDKQYHSIYEGDEASILNEFWKYMVNIEKEEIQPGEFCGMFIFTWTDFDLSFILQRTIVNYVSAQTCTLIPSMETINTFKQNGNAKVVNLSKVWSCNTYNTPKLWHVAAACKLIDVNSDTFKNYVNEDQAIFFKKLETNKEEALKQAMLETDMILNIAHLIY